MDLTQKAIDAKQFISDIHAEDVSRIIKKTLIVGAGSKGSIAHVRTYNGTEPHKWKHMDGRHRRKVAGRGVLHATKGFYGERKRGRRSNS